MKLLGKAVISVLSLRINGSTMRLVIFLVSGFSAIFFSSCFDGINGKKEVFHQTGAGESLDNWFSQRMDDRGQLDIGSWVRAFREMQHSRVLRGNMDPEWKTIGPNNIGGRTLCLAFHPTDPDIVFAGSASGGLWVTKTGGKGAAAWQRVPLGHPVLAVSSIVIDPLNPDRMWIGTGEMYSNGAVGPGAINRYTRGTYGIGVLKTIDGGQTWTPSLDWTYGDMRGVQKLAINPMNSDLLFAATSEGVYRTLNGGESWSKVLDHPMAVDIYIHPVDTQIVLVTTGSFFTADAGLYRSESGGNNFNKVTAGFPSDYTGKAMLGGTSAAPDVIYAYVANVLEGIGLYRSENTGVSWSQVNATNISLYQGWYAHHLAVNPEDPEHLILGGIDVYRSLNAGALLFQMGIWEAGAYGKLPAGGPEGPPYYVHADVHAVAFHPLKSNEAWIATDGGMFISEDGGMNFEGRNGGYQTQQFYSRFSSSAQDPGFAIGGMQDNGTAIYEGDLEWIKVLGGDGLSAIINPEDDQQVLASIQYLELQRSMNRGESFDHAAPPLPMDEQRAFSGAVCLDPNQTNTVLAGGQRLYRSEDFAEVDSWVALQTDPLDGGNIITFIEIAPGNIQRVLVVTSSDPMLTNGVNSGKILVSDNGGSGNNWVVASGLPARYCTSVAFHPLQADTVLATFSGFGSPHLYRSIDGGLSWGPYGNGLPDLPTNCVLFDPFEPSHIYLGNDLGVYLSEDGGQTWNPYVNGLPEACLVLDLNISATNKSLRAATHGLGTYESILKSQSLAIGQPNAGRFAVRRLYPNPVSDALYVEFNPGRTSALTMYLYDIQGIKRLAETFNGPNEIVKWKMPNLPEGVYWLVLDTGKNREVHTVVIQR